MIGRTLKHFAIEELLGKGGMGVVYRARDTRLQRAVALKVLAAEVTADPERKKRFLLEARAAARITHPAIAQVYDVDEVDGLIFIAMELVEGKTVADLIRHRELDLLGTLDIAIQVTEGLAKAHEAGIVHRDIKPVNVILSKDGHAKILDFGLAKLLDATAPAANPAGIADLSTLTATQPGLVMGTAAYMSPEQVRGGAIDPSSDLFSLGVMLFEMATYQSPFQRSSLMETMHAVAFDQTPSIHDVRPNLPLELQRIISRCLRKRPEDRYPNAATLANELKLLRRATESGWARSPSWRDRLADALDRLRHLKPIEYGWLTAAILAVGILLYLQLARVEWMSLIPFLVAGLFLYRHVRNRPQRLLEFFVRKTARIPEVRLISAADQQVTVVVDRSVAQLYGRINAQATACNKKLFFGKPISVAIRHDVTPEEFQSMLKAAGVHYVRDDSANREA